MTAPRGKTCTGTVWDVGPAAVCFECVRGPVMASPFTKIHHVLSQRYMTWMSVGVQWTCFSPMDDLREGRCYSGYEVCRAGKDTKSRCGRLWQACFFIFVSRSFLLLHDGPRSLCTTRLRESRLGRGGPKPFKCGEASGSGLGVRCFGGGSAKEVAELQGFPINIGRIGEGQ